MIQIRLSQFETNSSSVHSLVIPKDTKIDIPHSVYLFEGEYGWTEHKDYDTLSYFYTACVERGKEEVEKFFSYLKRKGVEEINSRELRWKKDSYEGKEYEYAEGFDGYIDHGGELPLDEFFANENLLDRFLFSEDSFVETGNDNSDYCPDADSYDHDIYDTIEKGN